MDKDPYQTLYLYSNDFVVQKAIQGFIEYFNSSEKIEHAFEVINNQELNYKNLGMNDHSIQVNSECVIFDLLYDMTGRELDCIYPFKMSISDFRNFLERAKEFVFKYENHEIPGLVPRKDFLKWSTAPNDQINYQYLEKKNKLCKFLLMEIGISKRLEEAIDLMRYSPQLMADLKNHSTITHKNETKIKGLRLAVEQAIGYGAYHGNIEATMYAKIIELKLEELRLPKSIYFAICDRIGYRDYDIDKLDELLKDWTSKLNNENLIKGLITSLELEDLENEVNETFKKYPNLLIELEELLPKHTEKLSRIFMREILKAKINSENSSENLHGYLRGRMIKFLIDKHELSDENWKTSEELRQWSFKNEWGLTKFEEYINQNLKINI